MPMKTNKLVLSVILCSLMFCEIGSECVAQGEIFKDCLPTTISSTVNCAALTKTVVTGNRCLPADPGISRTCFPIAGTETQNTQTGTATTATVVTGGIWTSPGYNSSPNNHVWTWDPAPNPGECGNVVLIGTTGYPNVYPLPATKNWSVTTVIWGTPITTLIPGKSCNVLVL